MSDKAARIKQIFIEEAQEIIEDINTKIFDFDENPTNKSYLNDIFRGIHTLKGSANSVGFTRLGSYVHHFEDILDYYREDGTQVSSDVINLFLDSVQVVTQMLELEINEDPNVPELYEETLQKIQKIIEDEGKETSASSTQEQEEIDLGSEFDNQTEDDAKECSQNELLASLTPDEKLFCIELKFEEDAYVRGADYANFLNMLQQDGRILCSNWDVSGVPDMDSLSLEENSIGNITIYFATKEDQSEIEEMFEFVEEEEYSIRAINSTQEAPSTPLNKIPEKDIVEVKKEIPVQTESPQPSDEKQEPQSTSQKQEIKVRSFVKIDTEKVDELFDSVGEMVIAQNFLMENEAIKTLQDVELNKTLETLFKITRLVQNRVMGLRMVQIRGTFDKMKRVVRDISRKLDKDVELILQGEDTEIDKTMVDKLSDPLIHIVRNSMDHGLEATKEARIAAGKSEQGKVTLKAYHQGGNIIIEVSDDGNGIDPKRILAKAIENGLTTQSEADLLSDTQILQFILQPGFSTVTEITDLSGRGVGMDVVNNFVRNMRGKIEIESELGKGSVFKIFMPLTMAIIDGMLVKSAGEIFIMPTLSIIESFRPLADSIYTAKGEGEFVKLRDDVLPIVRLNETLGVSNDHPKPSESILVCVEGQHGKYTILVDELIGRQQVVVKSVGKALSSIKEISGGAVLGNGEISLILNIDELYTVG